MVREPHLSFDKHVNEQVCIVVIDGESSNNIVSQALVDCLQLKDKPTFSTIDHMFNG